MANADLPTVLACGAWLKNAACLLLDGVPRWSRVHGDLGDPAACDALAESVRTLLATVHHIPAAVAHDRHPDFYSTRLAVELADTLGVPAIAVQHHHAHIATVMAEHQLAQPVIGLALDGVGLGSNGEAWGGELLWVDGARWRRLGHLAPLALPGGDRAAREPWRMAASVLHALGRGNEIVTRFGPVVGGTIAGGIQQMLARNVNSPRTSSAGRWFDAAAAALGLGPRVQAEAEAAVALETAARRGLVQLPTLPPSPGARIDADNCLDLHSLLAPLFDTTPETIDDAAAGFHLGFADALADWASRAAEDRGASVVCLGGGCFFNRILRERLTSRLATAGLDVRLPTASGYGDAGLALGQAWVAAHAVREEHPGVAMEIQPCV